MRTTRKPWYLRGRLRYVAAAALVLDLGVGVFSTAMAVASTGGSTDSGIVTTSSAVTVKWTDNRAAMDPDYVEGTGDPSDPNQPLFSNLAVTVAQTQNLTDQGLEVSWTGGTATSPGGAADDFVQIMQCWGSAADGPTPQQCQWGTPNASLAAQTGTGTSTRQLLTKSEADPKQDMGAAYSHTLIDGTVTHEVPFWSINDPKKKSLGWTTDPYKLPPFGAAQSNEVTYARTAADGSGQAIVNLQSAVSAPYLGCGNATYAAQGLTCWLVVVPRGEYDVNGQLAITHDDTLPQNSNYVDGSPLSASVWQDRIQVPLSFTPIGSNCQFGSSSINTAGSELISAAFASWQSALCAKNVTLGYSRIGDGEARGAVTTGSPSLDYLAEPAAPDLGSTIAYAPVADSGIVISYLIDKSYTHDPSNPDLSANGTLVTNLRLTPLLVAKLLTQSYSDDVPGGSSSPYESIRNDPEFLALNPEFAFFTPHAAPDGLLVPFGDSDAAKAVWAWLRSDSETRRFLAGLPVDGMTINPAYKGLGLATDTTLDSFPKADPATHFSSSTDACDPKKPKPNCEPGFGTLDLRPYTASFLDGAVRTVTATAGQKTTWDNTKVPPAYAGPGAQTPGSRFELAITTSQAAALYGLPTAALVDDSAAADDPGVQATSDAMAKQVAGASEATDVPGVSVVDPGDPVDGGYPLTMRTYAAINVCAADTATLAKYATYLDYVSGAGQVSGGRPGQLPYGYAPLSTDDRAQDRTVAAQLRAEVSSPQCASHQGGGTPSSSPSSTPSSSPTTSATPTGTPSSPAQPSSPASSAPAAPGGGTPSGGAPSASPSVATVAGDAAPGGLTPAAYVTPALRYGALAALCFALPCLIVGPRLLVTTRRRT